VLIPEGGEYLHETCIVGLQSGVAVIYFGVLAEAACALSLIPGGGETVAGGRRVLIPQSGATIGRGGGLFRRLYRAAISSLNHPPPPIGPIAPLRRIRRPHANHGGRGCSGGSTMRVHHSLNIWHLLLTPVLTLSLHLPPSCRSPLSPAMLPVLRCQSRWRRWQWWCYHAHTSPRSRRCSHFRSQVRAHILADPSSDERVGIVFCCPHNLIHTPAEHKLSPAARSGQAQSLSTFKCAPV
jgi:hypothetical protein